MKNATAIYYLCYRTIHLLVTLFEQLCNVFEWCRIKVSNLNHGICTKDDGCGSEFANLAKVPNHLTVLLGAEQPSYKDLANVINWCMLVRIPYLSFYDYKGVLNVNQSILEREVNSKKRNNQNIVWHNSKQPCKNGYSGPKIHVKILAPEDGRIGVANLAKSCTNLDYRIEDIHELLHKQFEFPDPELGFYCGKRFNLYKYPPWQIRVTEFLPIDSHHNITLQKFVKHLGRYSKCEQRLGK